MSIDERTYTQLVSTHHDRLVGLAYQLSSERELAEDAVAAVFERLWRRRDTLQLDNPGAYLARAVRNELVDRFRAAERERDALRRVAAEPPDPLRHEDVTDSRQLLDQLMATLPAPYRRTVDLRYLADLSEADTASVLDLPPGTVKSQAFRAIRRMRHALAA